ncbi:MAG: radical SAM protein, partial [Brevinematia bacterium]
MRISEIFESFQGEGNSVGRLALFIRVQGCPLNCTWCDTKYSITFNGGEERSVEELSKVIDNFLKIKKGIVVFTGGEPLYYQDEIIQIIANFPNEEIEFETSGIYLPKKDLSKFKFNVSPKLRGARLAEGVYKKIYSNLSEFKKLNS